MEEHRPQVGKPVKMLKFFGCSNFFKLNIYTSNIHSQKVFFMRFFLFFAVFGLCCVSVASAATPDYPALAKKLAAAGARQSEVYWQGEHFGDTQYSADAKVYGGRSAHDVTMLYWNFLNAALNRDASSQDRAVKHYNFIVKQFYDGNLKRFRTDYDFLMNTSIFMALLLSMRDAQAAIPIEMQQDIRRKAADIARYLHLGNTALIKTTTDWRANNQDAFATLALALIGKELNDSDITATALVKFRQVLALTQQSFWIEGGVDIGYQSVGEPAFAMAADLLWDHLLRDEKQKVAELALCAPVGNGYGIENARSPSWVRSSAASAFSSGWLSRIPNGFVAADADALFRRTAEKGFPSKWWLHDPASLSFFSGFYSNMDAIAAIRKRTERFSGGSTACQIMHRDEGKGFNSGMEKTYLTSASGVTAIFGDYSRLNPSQQRSKFGAVRPPFTPNPGGLRYLGSDGHFYIVSDDSLGLPRIVAKDSFRYPQLFHRAGFPGVGVSQYQLQQVLPGLNEEPPVVINQSFAVIGKSLLAIFESPEGLQNLRYNLSLPLHKLESVGTVTRIEQRTLGDNKRRDLTIHSFQCGKFELHRDAIQPYFKNKFDLSGRKVTFEQLRQLEIPFATAPVAALLFCPEDKISNVLFRQENQLLFVEFSTGDITYTAVAAFAPLQKLAFTVAGISVEIAAPRPGYIQVIGVATTAKPEVRCLAINAKELRLDGKTVWETPNATTVSALVYPDAVLLNSEGETLLQRFFGYSAESLVDNAHFQLPATLQADRIMITR